MLLREWCFSLLAEGQGLSKYEFKEEILEMLPPLQKVDFPPPLVRESHQRCDLD
jgi:hypothetical protein